VNTFMFTFLTISLTMSMVIILLLFFNKVLEKRISAMVRYYMWLIVLLGLLVPFRPSLTVPLESVQIPIAFGTTSISTEPAESEISQMLLQETAVASDITPNVQPIANQIVFNTVVLLVIWIIGMLIVFTFHLLAYSKFTASVRRWGVDVADEQTNLVFQKVRTDMGLTGTTIALKECIFLSSPMLIGFRNPTILLPGKLIPADELEHVFRHELTHYRRRDLWVNLLVLLVSIIHWFNPFVYVMTKAIRATCEVACDEAVVAGKDADRRRHYGETIISFIGTKNTKTHILSTYFYGGKNSMKKRLFSIMEIGQKRKGLATICALVIVTLTILSGSVFAATTTSGSRYISEAEAKSIALTHAGLTESEVMFIKAHLEREGLRMVYDIEFYSGNVEYDYEINAVSGTIMEFDRDIENYSIPNNSITQETAAPQSTSSNMGQDIGEAEAKAIALSHAGLSESQVTFVKAHFERDDRRMVYDVEFYSDNVEYDYEIDAVSGAILEFDRDIENYSIPNNFIEQETMSPQSISNGDVQHISESEAKSIALAAAGLIESQVSLVRVRLDYEDGKMVYEVEFHNGRMEYEYEIDAMTGNILKSDIDYDD